MMLKKKNFIGFMLGCTIAGLLLLSIQTVFAECSVTFSWLPNPESEQVQGYRIHYGTSQGGAYTETVEVGNPAPVDGRIRWTISSGFTEGTTYYFVSTAYNAAGESAYSDEVSWTCQNEPPPAGTEVTKIFGETADADYKGTVQDTFLNINTDVNVSDNSLNTYTWPADKPANAIIMKWSLSAIPASAQIQSATLYLYMNAAGGDDAYDISVHKIINHNPDLVHATGYTFDGTNSWTANSVCYDNIPLAQADIASTEDTKSLNKTYGYKTWNVTNMVKDWIANPASNYGLLLNSDMSASSDSNRMFASSEASDPNIRPKLVITYVVPNGSDTTPPGDVTGFNADPGPGQVTLSWTNPGDSDFSGVMIRYRTDGTYPQNYTDGTAIPNGNNGRIAGQPNAQGSYVHSGLDSNLTYYYSIFTYDTTGNYSQTAHAYATPLPEPPANQAPSISSFTADPNPADNPKGNISFSVQASDPDGDALSYTIDFGDGSSSASGSSAAHAYSSDGTYNAKATVSDGNGHTVEKTIQVTVNDSTPAKVTGVNAQ